jgi:uncharacterized membrane protein
MELPAIKIPEIALPFDVPVLFHPPVDHFIIVLPIVVLLLEIINLFVKKRAIGVVSFFLILLTVVAAVAAYFTGVTDGKEAWDLLSQAGQAELKAHKLLGTYLMLASGAVLVFKLLSAMIQKGLMKALFMLILILFVIGILKQGKDGGELVYKYGANIERVSDLDSELSDVKEELDELKEEAKKTPAAKAVEAVKTTASEVKEAVVKKVEEVKETTVPSVETATETVEKKVEEVKEAVAESAATVTTPNAEIPAVEVVPTEEAPKPEVATH